jgi:hypothetical protein
MKKLMPVIFFFCSLVIFADDDFYEEAIIRYKGAVIYSDGDRAGEHLIVLLPVTTYDGTKDAILIAYYVVTEMFKNTVELTSYGFTEFEGYYLYFEGGLSTKVTIQNNKVIAEVHFNLTLFDFDEKEGTITVRYNDYSPFSERVGKLITFKRTNKFNGKTFLIGI